MKNLIIVKPGTLKPSDKQKLTKAGNIVIEHPEPHTGIAQKNIEGSNDFYKHENCVRCGERVYMLSERIEALKKNKGSFYCSHGHCQSFI